MTTAHRIDDTRRQDGADRSPQPMDHRDQDRTPPAPDTSLLPPAEREEFTRRLHDAVNDFVDEPRRSVEEADALFEEVSRRVGALIAERHHGLRASWQGGDGDAVEAEKTEELRNALRRYRDAAEQLMRL